MENKHLHIKGMHCKNCVDSIEKKLRELKGVENVMVNLAKEEAFVKFNPEETSLGTINEEIEKLGYKPSVKTDDSPQERAVNIRLGKPVIVATLIGVTIIIGAITNGFGLFNSEQAEQNSSVKEEGFFEIPVSEVTGDAKWYEYDLNGTVIKFFAVMASNGSIKTAFDACDICYASKKGYSQDGENMVCNNCGNRYPINGLGAENKTPGGCWPGYLPSEIKEDNVLIKKSDLEDNKWRSL